jgi:hypothetical protein
MAKALKGNDVAKPVAAAATHLAASMRVVASHLHMRRATIDTGRDAVLDAARAAKAGTAGLETENLVARLEKVTGVGIAELGTAAEGWREV